MQNYKCVAENVYNTHDNTIDWVLLDDQEPITDLSAIIRVTIDIGGTIIDSDTAVPAGGVIWWTEQKDILWHGELITADVIKMLLGGQGLVEGIYNGCRLTVYDAANPNGTVWITDASITVQA